VNISYLPNGVEKLTNNVSSSPEDHAILEAAYLRNSKPDKAERTAIVSSVALGEKEVQVRKKTNARCALKD
jgi:hypothetical protein